MSSTTPWPVDSHVHTRFSRDCSTSPEAMISAAEELGLFGLAVTEHGSYEASEWVESFRDKTSVRLFRGAEVYTDWGHLQLFGISRDFWQNWTPSAQGQDHDYYDAERIARVTVEQAGIVVVPHPFLSGYKFLMGARCQSLQGVVALETRSGNRRVRMGDNLEAEALAIRLGLGQTGGSDAHHPHALARWVTYLPCPVRAEADWIRCLRSGGYFPGVMKRIEDPSDDEARG